MKNRAGEYIPNLSGKFQYRSFLPNSLLPVPPIDFDEDIIRILAKANRSIGILEGISSQIHDVDLFVSMYGIVEIPVAENNRFIFKKDRMKLNKMTEWKLRKTPIDYIIITR